MQQPQKPIYPCVCASVLSPSLLYLAICFQLLLPFLFSKPAFLIVTINTITAFIRFAIMGFESCLVQRPITVIRMKIKTVGAWWMGMEGIGVAILRHAILFALVICSRLPCLIAAMTFRVSGLFWTAPELLGEDVASLDAVGLGTREGDVYSYGIIMAEVLTNVPPYHDVCLGAREIVDIVARRAAPPENLRVSGSKMVYSYSERESENMRAGQLSISHSSALPCADPAFLYPSRVSSYPRPTSSDHGPAHLSGPRCLGRVQQGSWR